MAQDRLSYPILSCFIQLHGQTGLSVGLEINLPASVLDCLFTQSVLRSTGSLYLPGEPSSVSCGASKVMQNRSLKIAICDALQWIRRQIWN